ncbi:hypothetical protein M2650_01230 [Luteimonas sp. SX5]|uniref:Lipoprotein n=1 Tax=Luteimonas galliterrae TaxID=2940486 RepID=A0ABT0MEH0_9GAMM|nr:hypothetical protein [Luteimonas galliterrae]MCL1633271.1 hypothetical protein [Luteimonas galliterrae]
MSGAPGKREDCTGRGAFGRIRFLASAAVAAVLLAACHGPRKEEPPVIVPPPEPAEFVFADNANDTWNTVGQILVRLPGVDYESRAQIMGLYTVRYRGETMLVRTQALVLQQPSDGVRTRVFALLPDGKPNTAPAAHELLAELERRLPLEIEQYRTPVKLKKPGKKSKKKPAKKR